MTTRSPVAALLAIALLVISIDTTNADDGAGQPAASPVVVDLVKRSARKGGWVKLFMRDKRIISGRVTEVRSGEFDLVLDANGVCETFRYVDVKNAKGPPTRTSIKVAVAAGAIAGALLIFRFVLQPKT